jgi:hypothetical protein
VLRPRTDAHDVAEDQLCRREIQSSGRYGCHLAKRQDCGGLHPPRRERGRRHPRRCETERRGHVWKGVDATVARCRCGGPWPAPRPGWDGRAAWHGYGELVRRWRGELVRWSRRGPGWLRFAISKACTNGLHGRRQEASGLAGGRSEHMHSSGSNELAA